MKPIVHLLKRIILVLVCLGALAVLLVCFLRQRGWILLPQEAAPEQWEVFGVDVSAYQGEIDWPVLTGQQVAFAFIKASEGSSLQDRYFQSNWAGALAAGIRPGAYHFFSYDSPGQSQADNFISVVPVTPGALPPVVDLEFYGSYLQTPKAREEVAPQLNALLARLEDHYGVRPILYVTYRSYQLYLAGGDYDHYPIWFSSPLVAPLGHTWSFWQYSHSARLEGYYGTQDRIDLNVFAGSRSQFETFGLPAGPV